MNQQISQLTSTTTRDYFRHQRKSWEMGKASITNGGNVKSHDWRQVRIDKRAGSSVQSPRSGASSQRDLDLILGSSSAGVTWTKQNSQFWIGRRFSDVAALLCFAIVSLRESRKIGYHDLMWPSDHRAISFLPYRSGHFFSKILSHLRHAINILTWASFLALVKQTILPLKLKESETDNFLEELKSLDWRQVRIDKRAGSSVQSPRSGFKIF